MMPPPFAGDGDPGGSPGPGTRLRAGSASRTRLRADPAADGRAATVRRAGRAAAAPAPAIGGDLRDAAEPATPLGGWTDPARAARLRAAAADRAARQRLRGIVRDARAHAQAILEGHHRSARP